MKKRNWRQDLLRVYLLAMTVVVPLFMRNGYEQLGEVKSALYKDISLLVLIGLVFARAFSKEKPLEMGKRSVTDIFVVLMWMESLISMTYSLDVGTAFWGIDGWRMGFLSQSIMALYYFLYSRTRIFRKNGLFIFSLSAIPVFVMTLLTRFSLVSFGGLYENSFISTIGNINWYSGYLSIFLTVAALEFVVEEDKRLLWPVGFSAYIGFAGAATQGSAGGLLVTGLLFLIVFCIGFTEKKRLERAALLVVLFGAGCQTVRFFRVLGGGVGYYNQYYYYNESASGNFLTVGNTTLYVLLAGVILFLLVHFGIRGEAVMGAISRIGKVLPFLLTAAAGAAVILIIVNTASQGSLPLIGQNSLFYFDEDWGSGRGTTWIVGLETFAAQSPVRKLIGVGQDCFSYACYAVAPVAALLQKHFGSGVLRNAHNAWLTILVNQGILGAAAYTGIFGTALWRFIRAGRKEPALYVIAGAILVYLLHNCISFQQVTNTPYAFLLLALGEELWRRNSQEKTEE